MLPIPQSHGVSLVIGEILMKLEARELEIKGDEITLSQGVSYQRQRLLEVVACYVHYTGLNQFLIYVAQMLY